MLGYVLHRLQYLVEGMPGREICSLNTHSLPCVQLFSDVFGPVPDEDGEHKQYLLSYYMLIVCIILDILCQDGRKR